MRFVGGTSQDAEGLFLGEFFVKNTGNPLVPPYSAIGIIKEEQLVGVIVFNDYTGSSVEMHVYVPRNFNRRSIKFVLNYVYNELNCNIFIAKPHRSNKKLIKILSRLNSKAFKCIIPRYYGDTKDQDAILFVFDKEWASNWIKINAISTETTKAA